MCLIVLPTASSSCQLDGQRANGAELVVHPLNELYELDAPASLKQELRARVWKVIRTNLHGQGYTVVVQPRGEYLRAAMRSHLVAREWLRSPGGEVFVGVTDEDVGYVVARAGGEQHMVAGARSIATNMLMNPLLLVFRPAEHLSRVALVPVAYEVDLRMPLPLTVVVTGARARLREEITLRNGMRRVRYGLCRLGERCGDMRTVVDSGLFKGFPLSSVPGLLSLPTGDYTVSVERSSKAVAPAATFHHVQETLVEADSEYVGEPDP